MKPFLKLFGRKIVQYGEKEARCWCAKLVKFTIDQNILTIGVIFLPFSPTPEYGCH